MQRVRQMVLVTATLAGCGGVIAVEGVFEQRPPWVDAERLDEAGVYGRGQAYAVSNPHLRVSTADEQARAIVAKEAKAFLSQRLGTMDLDGTVREEALESLHSVVYSQAKVIARYYARDRLRQYSLARLSETGYAKQIQRLRIAPESKRALSAAGNGLFHQGTRTP